MTAARDRVRVLRFAAFADTVAGGNPAGVVLDATALSEADMRAIAADVGYSETAFLVPRAATARGRRPEYDVRYFTPEVEVPFCGHATIAAGVALARHDGPGPLVFHVAAGVVPVDTSRDPDGRWLATLTSVEPRVEEIGKGDLAEALTALGWLSGDLDAALPPRIASAGARHLVLAAGTRARLSHVHYDYDALGEVMRCLDLITVALIWRESEHSFHARNPAPSVGIVEDPATGAAAAALGGYLVALGRISPPATLSVQQGDDMGRPSRLLVELAVGRPQVRVTGAAVPMELAAEGTA